MSVIRLLKKKKLDPNHEQTEEQQLQEEQEERGRLNIRLQSIDLELNNMARRRENSPS